MELNAASSVLADRFSSREGGWSHTISFKENRLSYQSQGEPVGQLLMCSTGEISLYGNDGEWAVPPDYMVFIPRGRPFRLHARMPSAGLVTKFCQNEVTWERAGCWVAAQHKVARYLMDYSLKWRTSAERSSAQAAAFFTAFGEMLPGWFNKERMMWTPYANSPAIKRVLDFTLQTGPNVSLPEVAAHVGMSERTLRRHMQTDLGQSWREFIRELRMNRAMTLLRKDQMSITEVAFEVGFSSSSAFSSAFVEYVGTTPSIFAKTARKGSSASPGRSVSPSDPLAEFRTEMSEW